MKKTGSRKTVVTVLAVIAVAVLSVGYCLFTPMLRGGGRYLYIDGDDDIDSVYAKLGAIARPHAMTGFKAIVRLSSYGDGPLTGRYGIEEGDGAMTVFNKLKHGRQSPVKLTIPSVRTAGRLAEVLSGKLMADSLSIVKALTDSASCAKYGRTPETMLCMFIPNTYEIYWNTSVSGLLDRMNTECERFWNKERSQKAVAAGLSEDEVVTLASIVDEETSNDAEKPLVAGMYINRLKTGMPLQADPTIKFALQDFTIRRIYLKMLNVDSPYNTYKHTGLPPGPIRIPTVAGIDAVLDHVKHDYLYMCAKEDFSGTHNFAATYEEHLRNAGKYSKALNERGIK